MAFRPPCLWALYKKTKHSVQERTQKKQTSKQINKQKKTEVKMKTAKNTPTQHCPEKPTPSQLPPTPSLALSSLHLHFTLSSSHHLPSIPHFPLTRAQPPARTQARNQPHNRSRTELCCGYFSHGAAGRGPGGARLAPFTVPSPAFPPASPAPTPHSARITPPNTEKELAEYPHYAASLRQQKKEQRMTKNKQGG